MLRPRMIPALTLRDDGLIKTKNFSNEKYVGDPLNAVRIFNELSCDELIFLDIDATVKKHEPNFKLIERISSECRMPLCYGGGIKTLGHAEKILSLGVEKISVSSIIFENKKFINEVSSIIGSQSLVVCLDIKRNFFTKKYECFVENGKRKVKEDLSFIIKRVQEEGAGEILLNSIDRDGTRLGFDHELISNIIHNLSIPLTVCGGAKDFNSFSNVYKQYGTIGAAAGSMFVFQGKFDAVLINYPEDSKKRNIMEQ